MKAMAIACRSTEGFCRLLRGSITTIENRLPDGSAHNRSMLAEEAEHLLASRPHELSLVDRIRLMAWPAPILVFLYVLFVKGCILDGWPGWFYALQRTLAEIMIALEIIDRSRLSKMT